MGKSTIIVPEDRKGIRYLFGSVRIQKGNGYLLASVTLFENSAEFFVFTQQV
jgi:hypothetical protein